MQQADTEFLNKIASGFDIDKQVQSLCPVCLKVIDARIFQEGKAVLMEKRCPDHGAFKDVRWSDAEIYRRFMGYMDCDSSAEHKLLPAGNCPFDCGLCENHKTGTILGNIDITSRCNLSCPVCFADAGVGPAEPSMDQIIAMMQMLRDQKPVPCPAVQFSGGEPTIRNDLPEIVAKARDMGFAQIQIATNGLSLAANPDLCRDLIQNGLSTAYMQFDGVTPEPFVALRGRDLLQIKSKAIKNLREAGSKSVVLVPTLAKGINDSQVGEIIRFACKNIDVIRGINFQPISFAGRIDSEERVEKRLTISDLIYLVEDQTNNEITREDFYPIPFIAPISDFIAVETGMPQISFSVHPCCGAATYIYCLKDHLIPITRFVDAEGLVEMIRERVNGFDGSRRSKLWLKGMILKDFSKFIDKSKTPEGLNITGLLFSILKNGTREALIEFHSNTLFLGTMFFQDLYNIELERVQRCGIHYALPDGRVIPFCTYNTIHRCGHSEQKNSAGRSIE